MIDQNFNQELAALNRKFVSAIQLEKNEQKKVMLMEEHSLKSSDLNMKANNFYLIKEAVDYLKVKKLLKVTYKKDDEEPKTYSSENYDCKTLKAFMTLKSCQKLEKGYRLASESVPWEDGGNTLNAEGTSEFTRCFWQIADVLNHKHEIHVYVKNLPTVEFNGLTILKTVFDHICCPSSDCQQQVVVEDSSDNK